MYPMPHTTPTETAPVTVTLVDINPRIVAAWRAAFADCPEVRILHGSILRQPACAWVTPTNSLGSMDGGLDAVLKCHFGPVIEKRVRREIARSFGGFMPVGCATCVATGRDQPRFLISTPTMFSSCENIGGTTNVALACAAALQAVRVQNAAEPGTIRSVALPGLGAATGRVPPRLCAELMWKAYHLFRQQEQEDLAAARGCPGGYANGYEFTGGAEDWAGLN